MALASERHVVRELFVTAEAARREADLVAVARNAGATVIHVADRVAVALGETEHPQGVLAVVGIEPVALADVLVAKPRLVAVLVAAADPGNAGAIVRTADAAGADAVVLTAGSVDPYGGKCVRASAGSIFNLPVVTGVDVGAVLAELHQCGILALAATMDGGSIERIGAELRRPTAWLFGNEAHGLPADVTAAADRRVRVPIFGRAESLNVAAAAAVCLYESARVQRHESPEAGSGH
jgi:TrmH family RNA methyltransferase